MGFISAEWYQITQLGGPFRLPMIDLLASLFSLPDLVRLRLSYGKFRSIDGHLNGGLIAGWLPD